MIIIGSDHGGFSLKEKIKLQLKELSYDVLDVGCFDDKSVHYPNIVKLAIPKILSKKTSRGILICGTGIGMSMAANRFPKIRATLCHDHLTAKLCREHNDSNLLVMGGRVLGEETAFDIVLTWLNTEFQGGRHLERISLLEAVNQ